jgi:hypothetical protein
MIKVSSFSGETEHGPVVVPLFTEAGGDREKVASAELLPDVARYVSSLRPRTDAQYVLVNAMGAGEYYGSNINGDYFTEVSLIHRPDEWSGNPLLDKLRSKDWPWGFPTFYYAYPYAHHKNKDAKRAYGEVELSAWNERMKRVELVTRVDKDKCLEFGGIGVWDKLQAGQYPDVSMGCKVPFDTCSICLDWKMYREAQASFDPKKYKTPGEAVLAIHRSTQKLEKGKDGKPVWTGQGKIRGLSVTRKDYCEHAAKSMNRILSDGRKVFVFNDYPRFFDISFVFIGADRTAKVMMKIASVVVPEFISSVSQAEKLGYADGDELDKVAASPEDAILELAFGKRAALKQGEIVKDVVPSQFAGKAIPALTASEPDLPDDVIDTLAKVPLETALSTTGGLGMVLRPREFQRIVLISIGKRDTADEFDRHGIVFPRSNEHAPMKLGPDSFLAPLAKLLLPLFNARSALAPAIEKRVLISEGKTQKEKKGSSSLSSELLRKMGAGYNTYREQLMNLAAHAQPLLEQTARQGDLLKLSAASVDEAFSPLSVAYIKHAFMDELGARRENGLNPELATAGVERGFPSRNT